MQSTEKRGLRVIQGGLKDGPPQTEEVPEQEECKARELSEEEIGALKMLQRALIDYEAEAKFQAFLRKQATIRKMVISPILILDRIRSLQACIRAYQTVNAVCTEESKELWQKKHDAWFLARTFSEGSVQAGAARRAALDLTDEFAKCEKARIRNRTM